MKKEKRSRRKERRKRAGGEEKREISGTQMNKRSKRQKAKKESIRIKRSDHIKNVMCMCHKSPKTKSESKF